MSRRQPHATPRNARAHSKGAGAALPPAVARAVATTRIPAIDALRGGAILGMIAYHFAFDLNWFGVFRADFNNDMLWLTLESVRTASGGASRLSCSAPCL